MFKVAGQNGVVATGGCVCDTTAGVTIDPVPWAGLGGSHHNGGLLLEICSCRR